MRVVSIHACAQIETRRVEVARGKTHHEQGPDGVVKEDDRSGHEHGETDDFVQLQIRDRVSRATT